MTAATTPILDVRGAAKSFGGVKAVNDVSLKVMPGEIVSLIGPNGAGKTTTFNLISGVLPLSAGQILFKGDDTARMKASEPVLTVGLSRLSRSVSSPGS